MIKFFLVEDNKKMLEITEKLYTSDYIAVDTESDGLYSYEDRLCLVQIESQGEIYLIDSLSVDITPLKKIFESEKNEKIFHSANSDISMLKKNINSNFVNLFDIMIASKYIFKKALSLSNLVKNYFNFELNKKFQKMNWGKRPFYSDSLEYAAMDVYYLKRLRDIFFKHLNENGMYEEFKYTCERIGKTPAKINDFNIEKYVSMAHTYSLQGIEFCVFIEIVKKREEIAKRLNVPPFKIITNELLVYISKHYDEILSAVDIKLYNRCIVRNILWIRDVIKLAIQGEVEYFNCGYNRNNRSIEYENKIKMLKKWRREKAEKNSVPCELIVDINILRQISRLDKIDIEKLKESGMDDKRIEKYGKELVEYFNSL